MFDTAANTKRR
jgi:hypothetical protein